MSSSVASRLRISWPVTSLLGAAAATSLALLAVVASVDPASAQQSRPKSSTGPAKPQVAAPVTQPKGPLLAVVSIASQRITIYDRDGVVATSPVSSGRSGYETPQGIFSIIERKEEHFSNLYDDAPMPFMQRITWSGVAMHAGALPGYPASHGCIRLPHSFAERLFGLTKLNTRVVVAARDAAPTPIVHAALLQPSLPGLPAETPVAAAPAPAADVPAKRPSEPLKSEEAPMMLGLKPAKPDVPAVASSVVRPQSAVSSLIEAARVQKAAAADRAALALKAADQAKLVVKTKLVEARKAEAAVKVTEGQLKRAEMRTVALERAVTLAKTEDAIAKAKAAQEKLAEEIASLRKAAEDLKVAAVASATDAKAAADAVKAADAARIAAQAEAREAARRAEPVSVFVSRRTGKLYVRQAFQPVFEMPVTLKDPTLPIGTHVFTAMSEVPGKLALNWTVVTVESGLPDPAPQTSRRRGQPVEAPKLPARNWGSEALDRLQLPQEALDRITPYLQVGSSLIISDKGPSIETGKGTDFVILTRGEEQAAESIARYVAEQKRNGTRRN